MLYVNPVILFDALKSRAHAPVGMQSAESRLISNGFGFGQLVVAWPPEVARLISSVGGERKAIQLGTDE